MFKMVSVIPSKPNMLSSVPTSLVTPSWNTATISKISEFGKINDIKGHNNEHRAI